MKLDIAFLPHCKYSVTRGLTLVLASACAAAHGTNDCDGLATLTTVDSTVSSTAVVAAGTVINGATAPVSFCRVQGVAAPSGDSQIKWEVWLPLTTADWTGRMKVNGTGGYSGATPYPRLAQDIGDGFVTAGSNMGHDGGESAAWTLGHPEKVKDWGLRAHYSVGTAAKVLAAVYFGSPVRYSYFEGCSNGGRQAMMVAQNYPELFDGIVSGAPSMFYPDLLMWLLWTGKTLTPSAPFGPPSISDAKRAAITQRVLQACDANDGLVDGQITNPRACTFDIDTMGPTGDGTLSADEVAVVKAMYGGPHDERNGAQRYTGAKLGSEADWSPLFADNGGYGPFIGHYIYSLLSPPFDWRRDVNWSTVYDEAKAVLSPITAAPSPDIRRFTRRGGKLIQVHGWNDSVVPPDGSIGYFYALTLFEKLQNLPSKKIDAQIAKLTPQAVAATVNAFGKQVQQYHRLFMLPATAHCGGSTGPNAIGGGMPEPPQAYRDADHHAVSAVIKWVEQGIAPEKLIATKFDANGKPTRSRPVCPYPAEAVYNGSGDINDAANFSCRTKFASGKPMHSPPVCSNPAEAVYNNSGDIDDEASFSCSTPKLQGLIVTPGDLVHIRDSLSQRNLMLPNR